MEKNMRTEIEIFEKSKRVQSVIGIKFCQKWHYLIKSLWSIVVENADYDEICKKRFVMQYKGPI